MAKYALIRSKDIVSQREKETLLQLGLSAARFLGLTEKATALAAELNRVSPRLNTSPVQADWLRMADDFRNNEEWDSANTYYNKIINASAVTVFGAFTRWTAGTECDVYMALLRYSDIDEGSVAWAASFAGFPRDVRRTTGHPLEVRAVSTDAAAR